jgi:hypothetical protein
MEERTMIARIVFSVITLLAPIRANANNLQIANISLTGVDKVSDRTLVRQSFLLQRHP